MKGSAEFQRVAWPKYSIQEQFLFRRRFQADRINLFHSPFYTVPVFAGVPTVVTIYDTIPFLPSSWRHGIRKFVICTANVIGAHAATSITTISQRSLQDIVRFLKVPESKVSVAACGLSPSIETEPRAELFRQYRPYFACNTARHFESKNTALAIKAWRLFRERTGLKHKLLISGQIPEEGKNLLRQSGATEDCEFLGFVPDADLSSFFHNAEAFLIPSLYEGFGLPALEAMACGAPVISSTGGALPEVCGEAALYFDPQNADELADQMIRLSSDPELRARMSALGPPRAKRFTYEEAANRILNVYRRVLRNSN